MSSSSFTNCNVGDVERARSSDATIIDVREYAEFASARIPGSQLIPLGQLINRSGEIDRNRPVLVVCRSGRRSAEASAVLCRLGFQDVRNLTGGIEACREAGLPLERDAKAPWALERQVRFVAGAIVVLGVLLSVAVSPLFVMVSAFVGTGLMFSAVTDTCAMGLLIARLPWNTNLNAGKGTECTPPSRS